MIILSQSRGVLHGGTDPYISSVVFLNHFDALTGSQVQSSIGSHLNLDGTPATLSTTQVKFGAKSLYVGAGTNDAATVSTSYNPGTADFTHEGWFFTSTVTTYQSPFAIGPNGSTTAQRIYLYTDGSLVYNYLNIDRIQSAASVLSTNTWHFWQLRRIGTATELGLDGVKVGSTYTDTNNYNVASSQLWIGRDNFPASGYAIRGYVDDTRITNGVGRTFTVPTAAFPNF